MRTLRSRIFLFRGVHTPYANNKTNKKKKKKMKQKQNSLFATLFAAITLNVKVSQKYTHETKLKQWMDINIDFMS